MNARQRMIHRCQIERDTAWGEEAAPGHAADANWATQHAALPCLLWAEPAQGETHQPHRLAIIGGYRLLIPARVDVRERDRINGISDRNRRPIYAGLLQIEQIIQRGTHQLLLLQQVG